MLLLSFSGLDEGINFLSSGLNSMFNISNVIFFSVLYLDIDDSGKLIMLRICSSLSKRLKSNLNSFDSISGLILL